MLNNSISRSLKRLLLSICLIVAATQANAQTVHPQPQPMAPLTDDQVKAKYQNCPGGWYSGPRPGKTRYAKDPWLWVVTPEFAARYCMPPEFVSQELKGAEAVAFRILNKTDEENCGFGGNPNACAGDVVLRFDVYIKSDVKLPRTHEGKYFQVATLPSRKLISKTPSEQEARFRYFRRHPELALKPHFEGQQVGLHGVKDGVVVWPIVSLYQQTHFGSVFEGIDYYAFEGSTGFFENPGIKQNNVSRFFIDVAKLGDKRTSNRGAPLTDFAHVIELPKPFTDQVAKADRTRGRNVRAQLQEAFKPSR